MLVDKGADSRRRSECPFRDHRFNAELFIEVFRLQRKAVHQVSHIQHFGPFARDGFSDVAGVEVHQADAGIFHLSGADPVGAVVDVVRQTLIAARFKVSRIFRGRFLRH
ncbi:hypothetical protein D3C75_742450 [compost metagenome]